MKGHVIAVNTALITTGDGSAGSMGLGLAIPINDARFAASELREFGRIRPGWIGARLQQVTSDLATAMGLVNTDAIIVAGVDDKSPGGVRALMRMIAEYPLDHEAPLNVRRSGERVTLLLTAREYPSAKKEADYPFELASARALAADNVGLQTVPLTPMTRTRLNIAPDAVGVEFSQVTPGSAADSGGLHGGEVVLRVQAQPAASPEVV